MLGLPLGGWIRFYSWAFVAGLLLVFVQFDPIPALAIAEMILAIIGLALVALYARVCAPGVWRRWIVAARRARRSLRSH